MFAISNEGSKEQLSPKRPRIQKGYPEELQLVKQASSRFPRTGSTIPKIELSQKNARQKFTVGHSLSKAVCHEISFGCF